MLFVTEEQIWMSAQMMTLNHLFIIYTAKLKWYARRTYQVKSLYIYYVDFHTWNMLTVNNMQNNTKLLEFSMEYCCDCKPFQHWLGIIQTK